MKAWEAYLKRLCQTFGEEPIKRWLYSLKVLRFDARNLYLEANDSFQIMWFKEHIAKGLKKNFLTDSGHPIKVHITLKGHSPTPKPKPSSPLKITYDPESPDPKFTFDTFLEDTPSIAVQALKNLTFNPLFLYGPHGSGKTHLLSAFANLHPETFLVHAETFTEHVVKAMRNSDMDSFRKTYRSAKALIIDDIHLIKNRTATQEELFHTFNTLHTQGTQLIFSSPFPPSKLTNIEPRLISRFEWGLALPLDPPTKPLLAKILTHRLEDFPLDSECRQYLIETFNSPAAISEALEALMLRTHLENISTPLTLFQTQSLLKDLVAKQKAKAITPPEIIKAICDTFEIHADDLLGKSQTRACTQPRKIAMYLFRKILNMPYAKIGEHFARDHSTVMSSVRSIVKDEHALRETLTKLTFALSRN